MESIAQNTVLPLATNPIKTEADGMKINSAQGYTLIELLIVLTIAGLLSIGSLAGWQSWQQRQRLNDTARQLQRFLHGVRIFASWHNTAQRLWLKQGTRWCLGSGMMPENRCEPGRRLQLVAPHPTVKITAVIGEPGFFGLRDVARPGSIVFSDGHVTWRVVISSRGRIRLCKTEQESCL
ncbi:prepilin peptidase-dependent protein [Paramixta manurensis]|uniref:prepilin peptidase-dependent protein n=1 Tax=Paramixta manurensis TaxID=2740817 RepID=UPI003394EC15